MPLSVRSSIDRGDLALGIAHMMRDDGAAAVLVFDRNRRLIHHSPNAARLLALDPQTLIDSSAADFPPRVRELLKHTAQSGSSSCGTEFLQRPDQQTQNLRLTALPLHDAPASGATAILIQDLNHACRLENDLRQLDRLASMGTLAAEMAHEVKNALVAVKTFVDLLLEQNPDAELAGTVQHEMKRIDTIVAQVLKFSRNQTPAIEDVSLHAVLDRALRMMKARFSGRNITVVSRLAATPDLVRADENHLEQAVINLLLNASEAMTGDGTLSVETDLVTVADKNTAQFVAQRQLRLIIRDTGVGIPSDVMSHLFEPFFTTKKNGTGLGLAITRRIIHEHHGLISAESEPGKGAAFHIHLPAL
jgi:signal transduction histidine kinase